jgi:hypothetical protein
VEYLYILELKAQRSESKKNLQRFPNSKPDLLIRRYCLDKFYSLFAPCGTAFVGKHSHFSVQIFYSRGDLGIFRSTKRQVTMPEVCGS